MLDTRARGLHDRLVGCIGLDRLPVGQAPGVLEKTPLAGSMDETSRAFFRRLFLMGPSIEARTSRDHFVFAGPGRKKSHLVAPARKFSSGPSKDKVHVSFEYHRGELARAKCICNRLADVAARSASRWFERHNSNALKHAPKVGVKRRIASPTDSPS